MYIFQTLLCFRISTLKSMISLKENNEKGKTFAKRNVFSHWHAYNTVQVKQFLDSYDEIGGLFVKLILKP